MLQDAAQDIDIGDPDMYIPPRIIHKMIVPMLIHAMTFFRDVISGDQQKMDTSFADLLEVHQVTKQIHGT